TLGSVLTKTRKGTRASARSGDHAMATPRATPAAPASTNAPTISTAVVQACATQGISPEVRARATTAGLGRMYSRIPRLPEANGQGGSSPPKTTREGSWPTTQLGTAA